jgi:hypothetical protein
LLLAAGYAASESRERGTPKKAPGRPRGSLLDLKHGAPRRDELRGYFALAIFIRRSTVRQEYPHSLSYQETTLKKRFSPFRLFCRVARLS